MHEGEGRSGVSIMVAKPAGVLSRVCTHEENHFPIPKRRLSLIYNNFRDLLTRRSRVAGEIMAILCSCNRAQDSGINANAMQRERGERYNDRRLEADYL